MEAALQLMQLCPESSRCGIRAYNSRALAEVVTNWIDKGALCNLWPDPEHFVYTIIPGKTPNQ